MLNIKDLNPYTGKDGFTKVTASNEVAMEHSVIVFDKDGIYINESLIPYDYKTATLIYFVSDKSGNEYGQFKSKELALNKCQTLITLSAEQRKAYEI